MKACVFFIFQICPWIIRVGDWALRWTEGNEMIQVFFVMLFFPVVMNAIQYYIIDSFIKDQKPAEHEIDPSEDEDPGCGEGAGQPRRLRSEGGNLERSNESSVRDETSKNVPEVKVTEDGDKPRLRVDPKKLDEYDPAHDGEASSGSGEPEAPRSPVGDSKVRGQEESVKQA